MDEPKTYPAAFTVHWATGPTPCCVKHARALINLGRMLGAHVPATGAAEGDQCTNCVNEAKAAIGVTVTDRTHPECEWCTLCGKRDHVEAQCPTVASGVQEVPDAD